MSVYYNEIDPFAAAWLRELMKAGQIPDGKVDERDIRDVLPGDLAGFTHCHFFAGIGGWALALRLAGWPDDRAVWTGSCPCQPFSTSGAGGGGTDERHLWPAWFHLIERGRPPILFGEQVEAAIKFGWLDLVCDDLEGIGYAVAPVGLPAASVGAFHIRQRLWFVAESDRERGGEQGPEFCEAERRSVIRLLSDAGHSSADGLVADSHSGRCLEHAEQFSGEAQDSTDRDSRGQHVSRCGGSGDVGHPDNGNTSKQDAQGTQGWRSAKSSLGSQFSPWSDVIWLPCRDGKSRPTQPGLQPLVDGFPGRVGALRGAGNAITPQAAQIFIEAYLDCERNP